LPAGAGVTPVGRRARAGAGAACLGAVVLLGVAARRRELWLDQAVPSAARRFVDPGNGVVQALSSEIGWPFGAYVTALLPVAVTAVVLLGEAGRSGLAAVLGRWRWVLPTLAAVPVLYALRLGFGRPGPGEDRDGAVYVGAYPSGAALAVGLGWLLCLVVVGQLRPRLRGWLVAAAVVVLALHLVVRAMTDKHWASDVLGSYLLAAGAFLLAGAARPP
jgi:membrane-associated phospholipid phosphatase